MLIPLRILSIGLLALILAGCSSVDHKATGSHVASVSTVTVTADRNALNEFEKARLKEREVDHFVERELRSLLATEQKLAPTGPVMNVTIKDFHIRSTFAAVMAGAMAGTDFIEADVTITQKEKVLKRFSARSHALRGYGSEDRLQKMAENLAEDIVDAL